MYVHIQIPDIPEYPNGFPQFWLKRIFINSIAGNYQVNALAATYVRLIEAALVEYRLGRQTLKVFWNTHTHINLGAMHRAVSHFESCLSDMHRAVNCFTRLRRHRDLPKALIAAFNEIRPRFVADQVADQLREMRNAIHHLEQRVMNGDIQAQEPFALKADGPETPHATEVNQTDKMIDRLVLGQREIIFADLRSWLLEMAQFAERLSNYEVDPANPPRPA